MRAACAGAEEPTPSQPDRELGYKRPLRLSSVTFVIARKSGRMVDEGSAYNAVRHLVGRGHRRIGCIAGSLRIRNFPLRERGYLSALASSPACGRQ